VPFRSLSRLLPGLLAVALSLPLPRAVQAASPPRVSSTPPRHGSTVPVPGIGLTPVSPAPGAKDVRPVGTTASFVLTGPGAALGLPWQASLSDAEGTVSLPPDAILRTGDTVAVRLPALDRYTTYTLTLSGADPRSAIRATTEFETGSAIGEPTHVAVDVGPSVIAGSPLRLTVTLTDDYGDPAYGTVTVSSDASTDAVPQPSPAAGVYAWDLLDHVAGVHGFQVTVTGPYPGDGGTFPGQFRVLPGPAASLDLAPAATAFPADGVSRLSVASDVLDAYGNVLPTAPTVTLAGTPVPATAAGTYLLPPTTTAGDEVLTAAYGSLSRSLTVTAEAPPGLAPLPASIFPCGCLDGTSLSRTAGQSATTTGSLSTVAGTLTLSSGGTAEIALGGVACDVSAAATQVLVDGTPLWQGPGTDGGSFRLALLGDALFLHVGSVTTSLPLPAGTPGRAPLTLAAQSGTATWSGMTGDLGSPETLLLGGGEGSPAWTTASFWNAGLPVSITLGQMTSLLVAYVTMPNGAVVMVNSDQGTVTLPAEVGTYTITISWNWYPGWATIRYTGAQATIAEAPYAVTP
jgi:hypothetical protein